MSAERKWAGAGGAWRGALWMFGLLERGGNPSGTRLLAAFFAVVVGLTALERREFPPALAMLIPAAIMLGRHTTELLISRGTWSASESHTEQRIEQTTTTIHEDVAVRRAEPDAVAYGVESAP